MAAVLRDASARIGRPIALLSDEAYARIVFDGRRAASPARVLRPHLRAVLVRQAAAGARAAHRLHRDLARDARAEREALRRRR